LGTCISYLEKYLFQRRALLAVIHWFYLVN
jgi:hypothetical protein